ncbi:MAG TPA: 3-deoxy-manno-octulosonate cytidylyltransferase, partial [Candidatus Ozemobacteraceae bacterium]|nr:3-deoxy-manno-octulosonate cytidylyltransferase [Candidatus Ozemobacteraceae bacterium]
MAEQSRPAVQPIIVGVIPARLGSTRLPEKMLADICGEPLIVHTVRAAVNSGVFERVLAATDHPRIVEVVKRAGYDALLTAADHPSGTSRVAEVAARIEGDVFVNVQGDEPLIDAEGLRRLAEAFRQDPDLGMATLCFPLAAADEENPNAVKVVCDVRRNALYFSRSLIPHPRRREGFAPLKHIGVYGYRRETLMRLVQLPACPLEQIESLEQLRALYHGIPIRLVDAAR